MSDEKVLTRALAEQYAGFDFSVRISEFTRIDDDAFQTFEGESNIDWDLSGLSGLSASVAQSLVGALGAGSKLRVGDLRDLTADVWETLASHIGLLYVGITELTDEVAEQLSGHTGFLLGLDQVVQLSDAAAESLARHLAIWSVCV